MLTGLYSYMLEAIGPIYALQEVTAGPFAPGTTVQATAALSFLDTLFAGNAPDPTYAATASIAYWTVYQPDGTPSGPQFPDQFDANVAIVENCATVTFALFVQRAAAAAQFNAFTF